MRVYKEDSPRNTLFKIKKILQELNVLTFESSWHTPYDGLFSVRVQTFKEDGGCGQNGKGATRLYALASAYAEFMERLQNKIILYSEGVNSLLSSYWAHHIKNETGYYEFKDERFLSKEDILRLPAKLLQDLFGVADRETVDKLITPYVEDIYRQNFPGILSVPFMHFESKAIIYLPFFPLISSIGSNGMAAGNTAPEGIYQALCELIERYAASIVFYKMLTPPTIPDSFLSFHPQAYNLITTIRESGYEILVKDFSCGLRLPVVGTILIDKKKRKYRLNIGTDTSFPIALSRTLTELFQGVDRIDEFTLEMPTEEYPFFLNNDIPSLNKRTAEFEKFKVDSSGVFPFSLFAGDPSYDFEPETIFSPLETYKEEVDYLIRLLSKNGSEVYIRDVSILGFPSFLVYATDISVTGKKIAGFDIRNTYLHKVNPYCTPLENSLFPLNEFWEDTTRIAALLRVVESMDINDPLFDRKVNRMLALEFEKSFWTELPFSFIVGLLCYYTGDYEKAVLFMKRFVTALKMENNVYYQEVLKYFGSLARHESGATIQETIHPAVVRDFRKETLFDTIKVPRCPSCHACALSSTCITRGKVNLQKRIIKMSASTAQRGLAD